MTDLSLRREWPHVSACHDQLTPTAAGNQSRPIPLHSSSHTANCHPSLWDSPCSFRAISSSPWSHSLPTRAYMVCAYQSEQLFLHILSQSCRHKLMFRRSSYVNRFYWRIHIHNPHIYNQNEWQFTGTFVLPCYRMSDILPLVTGHEAWGLGLNCIVDNRSGNGLGNNNAKIRDYYFRGLNDNGVRMKESIDQASWAVWTEIRIKNPSD